MLSNLEIITKLSELNAPTNLVYLCYRGSISHNTFVPNTDPNSIDDIDLLGVFILPEEYYIGLSQHKSENPITIEIQKEIDGVLLDCVFYEIRHFVDMALKSNPNVFSALWVKPDHRIVSIGRFNAYLRHKEIFLSKRQIYKSFTGYANGQLKEMTRFNKQGYMGEKRKKLIEKFGYDVKNASHLIRLLHMGIETLRTAKVKVFRDVDARMLIDIKLGKWKLDEVKLYAEDLFYKAKKAYDRSTLPDKPSARFAEHILISILSNWISYNKI